MNADCSPYVLSVFCLVPPMPGGVVSSWHSLTAGIGRDSKYSDALWEDLNLREKVIRFRSIDRKSGCMLWCPFTSLLSSTAAFQSDQTFSHFLGFTHVSCTAKAIFGDCVVFRAAFCPRRSFVRMFHRFGEERWTIYFAFFSQIFYIFSAVSINLFLAR